MQTRERAHFARSVFSFIIIKKRKYLVRKHLVFKYLVRKGSGVDPVFIVVLSELSGTAHGISSSLRV